MTKTGKNKLVIIPAYNEEGAIVNTVEDIKKNAPSFDYIIINDQSTDTTKRICEEHDYNMITLSVNSGIGAAVQTGYMYGYRNGYEYAIQVDGDGQHDAQFLEEMALVMEREKPNMLIGSRFINNEGFQSTGLRRVGIRFFTWLIKVLTGSIVTDPTSGMRMVDRNIIALFSKEYPKDYPEPESVVSVLKKGYIVKEIPVEMKARESGESSISPKRSIYYMIKVPIACILAALSN